MDWNYLVFFTVLAITQHSGLAIRTDYVEFGASNSSKIESEEAELHTQFKQFVIRFNRSYINDPKEFTKRKYFFKQSLVRQRKLNDKEKKLGGRAVYGINMFSDLTPQEFKEFLRRGGIRSGHGLFSNTNPPEQCKHILNKEMPAHWNWHEHGKVTSIKNQGKCGSCWAFTAVEIVESQWAIKTGDLKVLSVQELVSCVPGFGCKGGNTYDALNWLVSYGTANYTERYTLAPESECPYEDKETSCDESLEHSSSGVEIKFPCHQFSIDEKTKLKSIIAFNGTVAVNVDATMWHDYISGIIQHHCDDIVINHAVQIVGYDTRGVIPYWIVRNSWGTQFGDDGYLYIEMGHNLCGLAKEVTYVVV